MIINIVQNYYHNNKYQFHLNLIIYLHFKHLDFLILLDLHQFVLVLIIFSSLYF